MTGPGQGAHPPAQAFSRAAAAFNLLASPVRLRIVWLLTQGEWEVAKLAQEVGATPQAVSQHLAKLKLAGAVSVRSEQRRRIYSLSDSTLSAVARVAIEAAATQSISEATAFSA